MIDSNEKEKFGAEIKVNRMNFVLVANMSRISHKFAKNDGKCCATLTTNVASISLRYVTTCTIYIEPALRIFIVVCGCGEKPSLLFPFHVLRLDLTFALFFALTLLCTCV